MRDVEQEEAAEKREQVAKEQEFGSIGTENLTCSNWEQSKMSTFENSSALWEAVEQVLMSVPLRNQLSPFLILVISHTDLLLIHKNASSLQYL